MKINILFHESALVSHVRRSAIAYMAKVWTEEGHTVRITKGIKNFIPADVCIVHVDLSVVPEAYIEYADKYPVVINGKISDIRKSRISRNLINKSDSYTGPVVLKSNLNYAGWPEKRVKMSALSQWIYKTRSRLMRASDTIRFQDDYRYYDSINEVPDHMFSNENYVVEKFLPEKRGNKYCVN
jgi:hypothetical protein